MGKIICEFHGEQSISFVSPLIRDYLNNKQLFSQIPIVKNILLTIFEVDGVYKMDERFIEENLGLDSYILTEEKAEAIFERLQPVCQKCLNVVGF